MSSGIALGLVIVALVVHRQERARTVRENCHPALPGLLAALGILALSFGVASVVKHHPLDAATVSLVMASLVVGAGFGVARARTVSVWREPGGPALCKDTARTTTLWFASVAAQFSIGAWIDKTTGAGALGFSALYLYLAVSLGTQSLLVRRRTASGPIHTPQLDGSASRSPRARVHTPS
ncbi:hypothetical protein [Streptomyces sp. NBC_00212]|uniref:hypothetical protein n=1 Tax=Streptomyces sp. NBC_00212 TaxID=2975684 RepID=UPI002F90B44D